jgi:hypothetical protein
MRQALRTTQVILILLVGVSASQSQTVEAAATQAEKRALVKELLDLTNTRQASETMFNAQFDQMEKQMPDIVWQAIAAMDDVKQLRPEQREQLRAKINESSLQLSQRMKAMFLQRIDMKQLVEDISYSVYDKHFTVNELKDLVTFYKSETGKKVIAEMPALYAESVAKAGEIVMPKVTEIMDEVQKDETKQLTQEIQRLLESTRKAVPPAPKRTPTRKKPSNH